MRETMELICAIDEFVAEARKHFEKHPQAGLRPVDPQHIRDLRSVTDRWTALRGGA